MKTKIVTFSVAFTMLLFAVNAQETDKSTFGIRAGINFQNLNGKNLNGDKLENDLKVGFNIGANAEIPVAPDFYIQPGFLFSTKGTKSTQELINAKINIAYIELPVNFLFKPVLGSGHLLAGFGPYIAWGVGGKVDYSDDGESLDIKFKNKLNVSDMDDAVFYLKHFDAGANLLFGYEFSFKLSVQLNAQLGLVKINPESEGGFDNKTIQKNTGFGISLGYRL